MNGECNEKEKEKEKEIENEVGWTIEIDVAEVVSIELNTTEVINTISTLTGIDSSDIIVGIETDEQGQVLRLVLYVREEEQANVIVDIVQNLDKGDDCSYGTLCHTTSIRLNPIDEVLISLGYALTENIYIFLSMLMVVNMIVF